MARIIKSTIPWPEETHQNYRLIIYKIERVTVNLLTLLNEAAEHNYEPYVSLLPNMRRRLEETHDAAIKMLYSAPTVSGRPPMWVTLTNKVIRSTEQMLLALDKIEEKAPRHLYETVISTTEVMLDACLELLEGFKKVPLADDTQDETNEDEDNNSDTLYLLDFSLFLKK